MTEPIVADVLTDRRVVKVRPTISVSEAAKIMKNNNVSAVLVVQGGALVGIISQRDIADRVVAGGLDVDATKVAAAMTRNPVFITPQTTVLEAVRAMKDLDLRHLPVVRLDPQPGEDVVVGVVSARDFVGDDIVELALKERLKAIEA